MGLEKVKEEIIKKTENQRDAIINEGKEEAEAIMKAAEERVNKKRKEMEEELEKLTELMKKTEVTSAELDVKKMLLEEKKKVTEEVFKAAEEKLAGLSDEKRGEHIRKLLKKAGKEIDVAMVFCNKKDAKFVNGVETKEICILGGIIAENSDRSIRIDYSYETILQETKEKSLREVTSLLFENHKTGF